MCLLIALAILFAGYNFYSHELFMQAGMSLSVSVVLISIFAYRMYKNRDCIFGDKKDCNKEIKKNKKA